MLTFTPGWAASKSRARPAQTESIGSVFWMCHQSMVFESADEPCLRQAGRSAAPAAAPARPRNERRRKALKFMESVPVAQARACGTAGQAGPAPGAGRGLSGPEIIGSRRHEGRDALCVERHRRTTAREGDGAIVGEVLGGGRREAREAGGAAVEHV